MNMQEREQLIERIGGQLPPEQRRVVQEALRAKMALDAQMAWVHHAIGSAAETLARGGQKLPEEFFDAAGVPPSQVDRYRELSAAIDADQLERHVAAWGTVEQLAAAARLGQKTLPSGMPATERVLQDLREGVIPTKRLHQRVRELSRACDMDEAPDSLGAGTTGRDAGCTEEITYSRGDDGDCEKWDPDSSHS